MCECDGLHRMKQPARMAFCWGGLPDTCGAKLVSVEVTGQTESVTTAEVSVRMAHWLEDETDAEEDES